MPDGTRPYRRNACRYCAEFATSGWRPRCTVRAALFLGALAACGVRTASALTVRVGSVDAPGGPVPRILLNGRPVRSRMFWGRPGQTALKIGRGMQIVSFVFTALGDARGRGTIHFRFGRKPGVIRLDDIRITDVESGRDVLPLCDFEKDGGLGGDWLFWPTGRANTVGKVAVAGNSRRGHVLQVTLRSPPDGRWPDFHVYHAPSLDIRAGRRYRVTFRAGADSPRDIVVNLYRPGTTFVLLGGPEGAYERQIRLAARHGIRFISFPVGPVPWPAPGESPDWSGVDARCRQVLAIYPEALLIPRIGMEPPAWWRKAHPSEYMLWDDGPRSRGFVPASPLYRAEAARRLKALVRHLEETFGEQVAGYHPCGQNTGEWFYLDTWKGPLNGYSPASVREFRGWLKRTYRTVDRLRAAWNDPAVTFTSAKTPPPEARRSAPAGVLRNPATERPLIDFARFQQDAMAECVLTLARAAREASAGRKLVLFFYGYVFEFGAVPNGPSVSGHYALRRVLASRDVDILCSPISYWDRGLGRSAPAMTAAESVLGAGKLWLFEDDTATHLSSGRFPGWTERTHSIDETNALLLRNCAEESLRGFADWWMDLGGSGWFDDERMWKVLDRIRPVDDWFLEHPTRFTPDIAAVVDEESMLHVAAGGHAVTRPLVYEGRRPLGRCGAPYGQYLLDDMLIGRVPARLRVFLAVWSLDASRRRALAQAVATGTNVWCYASGWITPDGPDLQAMQELTGFRFRLPDGIQALARPTSVGRRMGLSRPIGVRKVVKPLFAVADARPEEVLAVWENGDPAVVLRRREGRIDCFVGPPALTTDLLRVLAQTAGVHLFTDRDCNVYANGPFVALHAPAEGEYTVDVGVPGPVRDAINGTVLGHGPRLTLRLDAGRTLVLRCSQRVPVGAFPKAVPR